MPGISSDYRYIGILIQIMEAKAKTETIGKRHLVINHIALVDGVILLAHIAWHDVTAVGGYIKTDIVEPRGRGPLKQREESQGIATDIIKAKIVNEGDEWPRCLPQQREEIGQWLEPIGRDLAQR